MPAGTDTGVVVGAEPYASSDSRRLVRALGEEVERRYAGWDPDSGPAVPPPGARPAPLSLPHRHPGWAVSAEQVTPPRGRFVVARVDGDAVGCGALRALPDGDPTIGEIKRVYVAETARRLGVARAVIGDLVGVAPSLGFTRLVLETGEQQPEAIALYERSGWYPVVAYGEYQGSGDSRCFGLDLTGP